MRAFFLYSFYQNQINVTALNSGISVLVNLLPVSASCYLQSLPALIVQGYL